MSNVNVEAILGLQKNLERKLDSKMSDKDQVMIDLLGRLSSLEARLGDQQKIITN